MGMDLALALALRPGSWLWLWSLALAVALTLALALALALEYSCIGSIWSLGVLIALCLLMCLHVSWDGCWGTNVVSMDLLGQSAAVPVGVTIIGQVGRSCKSLLGLWLDCTAIPSQLLDCSPVLVSMLSLMLWMTLENHMVGSGVIKPPWSSLQACAFHVCGIIHFPLCR